MPRSQRPRKINRYQPLLEAAAGLFKRRGFEETSIRDIATEASMLPGSVYYHFPSKDELLVAIYKIGIEHHLKAARDAIATSKDPLSQLVAVCQAHMRAILGGSDFATVVVRVLPRNDTALFDRLVALRDEYEDIFRQLIAALPLAPGVNRKFLRLTLLGALNSAPVWYHSGLDDPKTIVDKIIQRFVDGEKRAA